MLEGLEAVELKLSEVMEDNEKFRIDSEYFKKEYLINFSNYILLKECSKTYELHSNGAFKDIFNILHDNQKKEVNYIRSENVGNFFISGKMEKISKTAHKRLIKTQTKLNDILIARTGKIGGASIITSEWLSSNTNQNVVNIRVNKNINAYFLLTFLNTIYGVNQFKRASTGNVQQWLNLSI